MTSKPQPRILLLQARELDDPCRLEEVQSFASRSRLAVDQFTPWDLLAGPPRASDLQRHEGLMVGGSGDYCVSQNNLPHQEETFDFLRHVVAIGLPTFASCFGFQLLVQALGGEVLYDAENLEVGTFELELTAAGLEDELFRSLPRTFRAQLGRKDRAAALPEQAVNLATSRRSPYQALRIPRAPIWASQFHPELDRSTNLGRYRRYAEAYAGILSLEEQERAVANFEESPQAARLLAAFIDLVFA